MTTPGDGSSDELDEAELGLLDEIRDLYDEIDPMPPSLVPRTHFALELAGTSFLLARPDPYRELATSARGGRDAAQYISFDSDLVTMIVAVVRNDDGTRWIEGHLAPPGSHPVWIRTPSGTRAAESDGDGRFELDQVPAGPAQLVVLVDGIDVVSSVVTV